MERLYIVSSKGIERCKRMHPVIVVYLSPVFTLGIRDASTSSVHHLLFLLCVCLEIVPDNPFGVVILFYLLSFAKLPIFIDLTYLLQNTLVFSFPFCFRKYSTVLLMFAADENAWRQPQKFGCPLCPFLHTLCVHRSVGPGLKSCHTFCDTGYRVFLSHQKVCPHL